jgi:hypothetical protein
MPHSIYEPPPREYVADVREWSLQPLKISNASAAAVHDDTADLAAATPSGANTAARPVAQSQSTMLRWGRCHGRGAFHKWTYSCLHGLHTLSAIHSHDSLQGAIDDDDTCASISELNFSLTSRDDAWRPMALLSTPKAKSSEDAAHGKPRLLLDKR